jgi:APA family basic amino acid/polyamine antiporter
LRRVANEASSHTVSGLGELRRILGPMTGAAICVGMAVGAGILRTPGQIAALLPSGPWIFGVWLLGALIATLDALILAEMSSSVPRVGGLVAYLHLSFGSLVAFLVGWSMLLVTWPASLAAVAVVTGELVHGGVDTLGADSPTSALGLTVAIAVIVVFGAVNLIGLRVGARFEIALFLLKVVLLAGVCIAAALAAPATVLPIAPDAAKVVPTSLVPLLGAIGGAMVSVIFSYDGYADAVYVAGETKDPGRALPRALFTALLTITGLYLLANATFLHVLGVQGLAASKFPALDVARAAFGEAGGTVLTAIAVVVLLGAVNAYFLTGPRIARVLAEEGLAMPLLGRVSDAGSPVAATIGIVVMAVLFVLTNTFNDLLAVTVPIISVTTALVAVGLLVQRRRAPDRPRPFRVPAAWFVVGLQVVIGMVLLAGYLVDNPKALAIDAAALAVGVGVYFVVRRRT